MMTDRDARDARLGEPLLCPFCGGEASIIHGHYWHVGCSACQAHSAFTEDRPTAVAAWNRRVALTELARLRGLVATYEAPGGWSVLMARESFRLMGDPRTGVSFTNTGEIGHNAQADEAGAVDG